MLTFRTFQGINNVQPDERLVPDRGGSALRTATNVDIGLTGELLRRQGWSEVAATCHKNLWQADGFRLATVDGNDLVALDDADAQTVVQAALGPSRVWYCNLPDGRTTWSNGLINGITDGTTTTSWGVPIPASLGTPTSVSGDLDPGDYQYQLTHERLSDGRESGPLYSNPVTLAGGIVLAGVPVLAGHRTNVYLTGLNGSSAYYAGTTTTGAFSFTGRNELLTRPCRTEYLEPAPAGTVTAFWRGRVLVAVGSVLYASLPSQWELFDIRRDFKQFSAPITLIQPVDGGLFVGTEKELAFLAGTEFDKLIYTRKVEGRTVLGSGVSVRGELLQQNEGAGLGTGMVCIADRVLVAGFSDGQVVRMTEGRYETGVTEVAAVFRMRDRIPQYIAIPQ